MAMPTIIMKFNVSELLNTNAKAKAKANKEKSYMAIYTLPRMKCSSALECDNKWANKKLHINNIEIFQIQKHI